MNDSKKSTKNKKNKLSIAFLYHLTKVLIAAFVIFCIILLILYIVGNYQEFQDKSQQIIFSVLSYISIFTMLLTVCVIVESFFRAFEKENIVKSIITIILMIFTIVFCFTCLSISIIVEKLSIGF